MVRVFQVRSLVTDYGGNLGWRERAEEPIGHEHLPGATSYGERYRRRRRQHHQLVGIEALVMTDERVHPGSHLGPPCPQGRPCSEGGHHNGTQEGGRADR
jgi:hypothetical protein